MKVKTGSSCISFLLLRFEKDIGKTIEQIREGIVLEIAQSFSHKVSVKSVQPRNFF
jgi:hypothetical protein